MATDDRYRFGEYGGKPGLIQKKADGHENLAAHEKAQIIRTYGIGGQEGMSEDQVNKGVERYDPEEKWEDAGHRARVLDRRAKEKRMNGYRVEDVD